MQWELDGAPARGLQRYVSLVARALGLRTESTCGHLRRRLLRGEDVGQPEPPNLRDQDRADDLFRRLAVYAAPTITGRTA